MRCTVAKSVKDRFQLEKGTVGTYYKPYKTIIPKKNFELDIYEQDLHLKSVSPQKTTFFVQSKNLFDISKAVKGGILDAKLGTIDWNSTLYHMSDYIPVEENTKYTRSWNYSYLCYDKYKNFITGFVDATNQTITAPKDCAYIRFAILNTKLNEYMVEVGETKSPYEEYKLNIPKKYLDLEGVGGGSGNNQLNIDIFTNTTTDTTSRIFDCDGYTNCIINVDKNSRGRIIVKASKDNITWTTLNVKNQNTGVVNPNIYTQGLYVVSLIGYKYLKFESVMLVYDGVILNATGVLTTSNIEYNIENKHSVAQKRPSNPLPTVTITSDTGQGYYKAGRSENIIYAITGTLLRKSINNGTSFTTLYNFGTGKIVRNVELADDGTLLVATEGGELYKSSLDETTYTKVLTFETPNANISNSFGFHTYSNVVIVSEYGNASAFPNNPNKVYLSTDFGTTFKKVFTGKSDRVYHIHDVCYDMYSSILWVTCGDGVNGSNIHYSLDMGVTWKDVYAFGDCPNQFTTIIPLPNCVLFVSDNKNVGVWKWERPINVVNVNTKIRVEPCLIISDNYQGAEPIGTRAGVIYGENALAYFSFSFFKDNVLMPCIIWGTNDGVNFYEIWRYEKTPSTINTQTCGIMTISNPTQNGNIIASLYDEGMKRVFINNPNWVNI